MVHGMSQDRRVFSAQVGAFQKNYRLLLIDLPGHGKSSAMSGPYGPEEYAAATLAAMDAADVESTHFWGTHTGAGVGLLLATRQPRRFASLILEGAVIPGVVLPSVTKHVDRAKATAAERGVEAARLEWFTEAEWFDVIRREPERCRALDVRGIQSGHRCRGVLLGPVRPAHLRRFPVSRQIDEEQPIVVLKLADLGGEQSSVL